MSTFRFKQFDIRQTNAAMKVGTDAMLLGALCRFDVGGKLLDVGTGTGVLSLIAAQRFAPESITAVEIEPSAAEDARHNFAQSPFPAPVRLVCEDLLTWETAELFDGIVSNPPFFENSSKSTSGERNRARHTDELPFPALMQRCAQLLAPKGMFWLIVPAEAQTTVTAAGEQNGLFLREVVRIQGKPGALVRTVLCFGKIPGETVVSELTVRNTDGTYTAAYIALTRDLHHTDLSLSQVGQQRS